MSLSTGCVLDVDASAIESGISRDRNHHTLTPTDTTTVRGKAGKGTLFNGTTSFVDCGNDSSLDITDAITIETWAYINSGSSTGYIITKNNLGVADHQYAFFWNSPNCRIEGLLEGAATGWAAVNSVMPEQWYHIIMRYDKTDVRYYINGELSGTPFAKTDSITSNDFTVNIGRRKPSNIYLNGTISSVHIYNYALSPTQIKRNYLSKAYLHVLHPVRIP